MANNQRNVQPNVVTTTTTTTSRRGRRRRRRTPRTSTPNTTTVRKVTTTRQPTRISRRRRNRFSNSRRATPGTIKQKITATLGTVGSNQGGDIETEMSLMINPALMKETSGSNQLGPLQILASSYSLWKVDYLALKLTPLVGGSAVSGTAIRASYNLSGQPGAASWSALGARKHKDTNPGRQMVFYLSGSDIKGPKDGWFFCNTKNDPQLCTAGTLEIHTMGQTLSTYKNEDFKGPLFLVELTSQWSFKNYNPQPGMANLIKASLKEEPQSVKIHGKPGAPITISVPNDSSLVRTMRQVDLGVDADADPSEIIWMVCDTVMDVISGPLPEPFSWLFRAGWWFVKRIANRKAAGSDPVKGEPNAGEVTFQVFQSMTDAMNGTPCLATSPAESTNVKVTGWNIMQITPGNVGQPQNIGSASRSMATTLDPIEITSRPAFGRPYLYGHIHTTPPHSCIVAQNALGSEKVYTYTIWELEHPTFMQNGQPVNPAQLQSQSYPIYEKANQTFNPIGRVYAAGYTRIGSVPTLCHWTTVLWRADVTKELVLQGNTNKTDAFVYVTPTQSPQPADFPRTTYTITPTAAQSFGGGNIKRVTITQGQWYISSFVAYQVVADKAPEFTNYGVPFYLSIKFPTIATTSCEPPTTAFEIGAVMQSTMPLVLKPPSPTATTLTAAEVAQLRQLLVPRDEYTPSEYDNMEMPPLEGEEEEERGAAGGTELQRDVNNWVEFGYRKRPPTPFTPIEEEEEEDEDSDLDDDDYADPPSVIRNLLTPEAKDLYGDLRRKGLSHEQATRAAQAAFPHFALEAWDAAYHNAMADGLSPPTARDCAWSAVSDFLP
nr:MAG: ORF2 [Xinjiang mamastrovirus 3]